MESAILTYAVYTARFCIRLFDTKFQVSVCAIMEAFVCLFTYMWAKELASKAWKLPKTTPEEEWKNINRGAFIQEFIMLCVYLLSDPLPTEILQNMSTWLYIIGLVSTFTTVSLLIMLHDEVKKKAAGTC